MRFDEKEVKKILKLIDFSLFDFEDFCEDWVETTFSYTNEYNFLINELKINICYGATKLVFIPEDQDFVIKIPFNGVMDDNNETEELEFKEFHYARYPITGGAGYDYCRSEAEYYECAEELGIQDLFCGTYYYTTIHNIPIYIAEKAEKTGRYLDDLTQEEYDTTSDIIKNKNLYNVFNYTFFNKALNFVSLDCLENFYHFLEDCSLHDFYSDNYGILKNGCPVLVDYSDYRD